MDEVNKFVLEIRNKFGFNDISLLKLVLVFLENSEEKYINGCVDCWVSCIMHKLKQNVIFYYYLIVFFSCIDNIYKNYILNEVVYNCRYTIL